MHADDPPGSAARPGPSTRKAKNEDRARATEPDFAPHAPVGHLLRRVYHKARETSADLYREFEVTPQQAAALFSIRRRASLSQAEIGEAIAMEPANVHGLIARLKAKKLIEAERDPADPRRMRIRLSKIGEDITAALAEAAKRSEEATLSALSTSERAALVRLLRKMLAHETGP
ncbi:MarR family winged helix-turn-helix transcriptional regulator [Roseiarcaceae bacterium H3SJ34-1]|uniref:MarR family winged helix-turn-helix transcriptional regulator n=1 Tax=Terripilifer ovatus TaxID=3032367 RepID=UPI003AB93B6C|nr:MarR family winged helix-turn-helix transcriptional regulator [Roseiarcaceae bacterium H3SJ34-1]